MLLQGIAVGACELLGFADGDAPVLAGELDNPITPNCVSVVTANLPDYTQSSVGGLEMGALEVFVRRRTNDVGMALSASIWDTPAFPQVTKLGGVSAGTCAQRASKRPETLSVLPECPLRKEYGELVPRQCSGSEIEIVHYPVRYLRQALPALASFWGNR